MLRPPSNSLTRLGVSLKREETGKLFPVTDSARTVLEALTGAVQPGGIRCSARVNGIGRKDGHFILETTGDPVRARRVVLASGGKSVPQTGSDGAGYELARSLGHSVTATFPGLVPLLVQPGHWSARLSGVSAEVELTLHSSSGKRIRRERGSILFTHFGVSGPVVLDMSRHWIAEGSPSAGLKMNVLPAMDFASVDSWIVREAKRRPRASLSTLLQGRLPERLVSALVSTASIDPAIHCGRLDREMRRRLAHTLTELPLPITGDRGFRFAEVTAGGVPLTEINPSTMQSRLCEGLYLCGEILDVDGRIGGYNFQWAWASGRLAGMSAVRSLCGRAAAIGCSSPARSHCLKTSSTGVMRTFSALIFNFMAPMTASSSVISFAFGAS